MLESSTGTANFFSCRYSPGEMKAHIWWSRKGMPRKTAVNTDSLNGVRNGDATSVAIMLPPPGRCAISGAATSSYRSLA